MAARPKLVADCSSSETGPGPFSARPRRGWGRRIYAAIGHHRRPGGGLVVRAIRAYDVSPAPARTAGSLGLALAAHLGLRTSDRGVCRPWLPGGRHARPTRRGWRRPEQSPGVVAVRMLRLLTDGTLTANDGSRVTVETESICTHGDTPVAVAIARARTRSATSVNARAWSRRVRAWAGVQVVARTPGREVTAVPSPRAAPCVAGPAGACPAGGRARPATTRRAGHPR